MIPAFAGMLFGLLVGFVLRMVTQRGELTQLEARERALANRPSPTDVLKTKKKQVFETARRRREALAERAGMTIEEATLTLLAGARAGSGSRDAASSAEGSRDAAWSAEGSRDAARSGVGSRDATWSGAGSRDAAWAGAGSQGAAFAVDATAAARRAARLLRDVLERYDGHILLDRTVYPVRSDDVIAKETARRVQQSGATDAKSVEANVRKDARRAGRDAFKALKLDIPPERTAALVGALKFRTSYAQNQLAHSIEVAQLAGLLALELGLDPVPARRSGLLHDMAKAETHDRDGSHAIIGARIAYENGESPVVVNAIAAHHGEVAQESPIAALLITADTASGARPGARRQTLYDYAGMVRDIVTRAQARAGVTTVDVMQAGREVRVMVDTSVSDTMLPDVARAIASDLEQTPGLTGFVRVTVIRETRAHAIAR